MKLITLVAALLTSAVLVTPTVSGVGTESAAVAASA